ncbi:MAG: pilus assembly protein [Deltaproteobacteria bacterium]|nr:MAG: pilus assembly protein [Deltaproteobacteria bacterium]
MISQLRVRIGALLRREEGQAVVETAFSISFFLILVLGIIQAALIANAKLIVNYAAYSAARTGIVTGGNVRLMRRAAAIACLPLNRGPDYGAGNPAGAARGMGNTTNETVLRNKLAQDLRDGLTVVRVLHPTQADFTNVGVGGGSNRIIRFDDFRNPASLAEAVLTVQVTHYFKLEIPIVNTVFAEFMPAQIAGGYAGADAANVAYEADPTLSDASPETDDWLRRYETSKIVGVMATENRGGRRFFREILRIPITAHYTMRMQTDLRQENLNDPGFFSFSDLPTNDNEMQRILKGFAPQTAMEYAGGTGVDTTADGYDILLHPDMNDL